MDVKNVIKKFFETVDSVDHTEALTAKGDSIVIEYYTSSDIEAGKNAFKYLTQKEREFPEVLNDDDDDYYDDDNDNDSNNDDGDDDNDMFPAVLYGFTISIETCKNGELRVATISPTYDDGDNGLFDYDCCDIVCDIDEVLRLRETVITSWRQIEQIINELVRNELRSDADNITPSGRKYIEETTPAKVFELLQNEIAEEKLSGPMSREIITARFNDVLRDSPIKLKI